MAQIYRPADPEAAAANWERWLKITGNRAVHDQAEFLPSLTALFGASQQLSEVVIQNPELAYSLQDEDWLGIKLTTAEVVREGERLLQSAPSHTFKLDRLRYLRQMLVLRIATRDILGLAPQPDIWHELSALAEGLVRLTHDIVWRHVAEERGLELHNPVAVFAFGKLGGSELNYSSDIDLVYVVPDEVEIDENILARYCERLGRALSDSMGRGALYRVDLRLRPYGKSGPIFVRETSWRKYYANYSEAWEQLALIRARQIAGPAITSFEQMRQDTIFGRSHGEWFLDQLLAMRAQVETFRGDRDLKRGVGGIRDIEFLTQILQAFTAGTENPVTTWPTLDALNGLSFEPQKKEELARHYTFLRQLEHRIQLGEGLQTHDLPTAPRELARVAHLMGLASGDDLEAEVARVRARVRTIYDETFGRGESRAETDDLAEWLGLVDEGAQYASMIRGSDEASRRVDELRTAAPWLAEIVRRNPALLDQILSGEVEEELAPWSGGRPVLRWQTTLVRFALGIDPEPWSAMSKLANEVVELHFGALPLAWVALGSFAAGELGPNSDLDLVLFSIGDQTASESAAQEAIRAWPTTPFELDLRLRPNAGRGLLAPTFEALHTYARDEMENWERLALRRAASRNLEALTAVQSARKLEMSADVVEELFAMKSRIEKERCKVAYDLKLGPGGIDDLQWGIQLHALAHTVEVAIDTPSALQAIVAPHLIPIWRSLMQARYQSFVATGEPNVPPEDPNVAGRERIREFLESGWRNLRSK